MEVKEIVIGIVIGGVLVGGYNKYLRTAGEAALNQANGYGKVLECASLLGSKDKAAMEDFLKNIVEQQEELDESDAFVSAVASVANGEVTLSGMGRPLRQCTVTLSKEYNKLQ